MAALVEPAPQLPPLEMRDLRGLRGSDLNALLAEEIEVWREELDWDFEKSAELVRKFVDIQALNGWALAGPTGIVGYSYYIFEDEKGVIGDLFVAAAFRTPENEERLLAAVLRGLIGVPYVRRVESQLMMLGWPVPRPAPGEKFLSLYPRDFLLRDLTEMSPLSPVRRQPTRVVLAPWEDHYQESAAYLIADAYEEHVDAFINDQYRTLPGARRFLYNIVQYPGCGTFFKEASVAALDSRTGALCGMCLTSIVGPETGHITQICVAPESQGTGLGNELLRHSLEALRARGYLRASLTVTSANRTALRLYQTMGFRQRRHFTACVWEGF